VQIVLSNPELLQEWFVLYSPSVADFWFVCWHFVSQETWVERNVRPHFQHEAATVR
jgi:hypothetical protein